jgi:hypothetical protein
MDDSVVLLPLVFGGEGDKGNAALATHGLHVFRITVRVGVRVRVA